MLHDSRSKTIVIVGSGHMGTAIAASLLHENVKILLIDSEQHALERAANALATGDIDYDITDRLTLTTDMSEAADAWLIFEAVPEDLRLKKAVFEELEPYVAEDCLLASNTSGLPIGEVAEVLTSKHRFFGTHFFTPADVIPLVEVVKGPETTDAAIQSVANFLRSVGKHPVIVEKDIPGFIANRIQHAMAREAMSLVEKGVATPEAIDEVVRWSLGIRLALMGPLKQRDFNGLDTHLHIASYLYKELENSREPPTVLRDKVNSGDLGLKSGRGFYDWSAVDPEAARRDNERVLRELIEWLKPSHEEES